MSRLRLTNPSHPINSKQAAMKKKADPYELNDGMGHSDPYDKGLDVYQKSQPHSQGTSGWAEDVDDRGMKLIKQDGASNEIHMPEARKEAMELRKALVRSARQDQDQTVNFRKHASDCLKVAIALFPEAHEKFQEETASELMDLPTNSVVSMARRLAAYDRFANEMLEAEQSLVAGKEQDEDEKEAADKEEDKEEDKKEDKKEELSKAASLKNRIRKLAEELQFVAEAKEEDAPAKKEDKKEDKIEASNEMAELEAAVAGLEQIAATTASKKAYNYEVNKLTRRMSALKAHITKLADGDEMPGMFPPSKKPVAAPVPEKMEEEVASEDEIQALEAMQAELAAMEAEVMALEDEDSMKEETSSMYMQNATEVPEMKETAAKKRVEAPAEEMGDAPAEDAPAEDEMEEEEVKEEATELEDEDTTANLEHAYGQSFGGPDPTASDISFADDLSASAVNATVSNLAKKFGDKYVKAALATLGGRVPQIQTMETVAKVGKNVVIQNQPKKASVQKLPANIAMKKTASNTVSLNDLWGSSPDVSHVFGSNRY